MLITDTMFRTKERSHRPFMAPLFSASFRANAIGKRTEKDRRREEREKEENSLKMDWLCRAP